jgi:hypothetical protein
LAKVRSASWDSAISVARFWTGIRCIACACPRSCQLANSGRLLFTA